MTDIAAIHVGGPSSSPGPQPRTFVTGDSLRLCADAWTPPEGDSGLEIVLLHGSGQARQSWNAAARALSSRGHHVLTIDGRGHGESDWSPDGDYLIGSQARDVASVVRAGGRPTILVGASIGGLVALMSAQDCRQQLVGIVLVDIVPRFDERGSRRIRDFMISGLAGYGTLDEVADAIAFYLPHRPRPTDHEKLRRKLRLGPDKRWYWRWDPAVMTPPGEDRSERIARIERAVIESPAPLMLAWGEESDVVTAEGVARLLDIAPRTQIVQIPGVRHSAATEDNDAFVNMVSGFVDQIAVPRSD